MRMIALSLLVLAFPIFAAQGPILNPTKGSWCAAVLSQVRAARPVDPAVRTALEQAEQKLTQVGESRVSSSEASARNAKDILRSDSSFLEDVTSPRSKVERSRLRRRIRSVIQDLETANDVEPAWGKVISGKTEILEFLRSVEELAHNLDAEYASDFDPTLGKRNRSTFYWTALNGYLMLSTAAMTADSFEVGNDLLGVVLGGAAVHFAFRTLSDARRLNEAVWSRMTSKGRIRFQNKRNPERSDASLWHIDDIRGVLQSAHPPDSFAYSSVSLPVPAEVSDESRANPAQQTVAENARFMSLYKAAVSDKSRRSYALVSDLLFYFQEQQPLLVSTVRLKRVGDP